MKVVLLGKTGMLGSAFLKLMAGGGFQVFAFGSADLDVTDFAKVEEVMAQIGPDFVINCTGYTKVDLAETERERAFLVNGEAVRNLAHVCKKLESKLLHFSTDYVFSGEKDSGYKEDDLVGPINVYGESKLAGEEAVLESGAYAWIVRTSWLFGPDGRNFVTAMIDAGRKNGEVSVVFDQFGFPTYTYDLVKVVIDNFLGGKVGPGIYHLTNSGKASWFEFATNIFDLADMKVTIYPITSSELVRAAARPKFSMLVNTKLPLLRPYEEALKAYIGLHY